MSRLLWPAPGAGRPDSHVVTDTVDLLPPNRSAHLAEFARACRAAARAVSMYPATHPAIQQALGRIAEAGRQLTAEGSVSLTVLPAGLLLDGRGAERPDASIAELAALLHAHRIGELAIFGAMTASAWLAFLELLAVPVEEVHARGGIARLWHERDAGPLDIRQIDYSEVLKARDGTAATDWDRIVTDYLEGERSELDEQAIAELLEIADDPARLGEFTERLMERAQEGTGGVRKDVVLRILQVLADFVAQARPQQLDSVLHYIAGLIPRLTPEVVAPLLSAPGAGHRPGIDLAGEVRARASDETIVEFVAHSVARDRGATARLAEAFQTLVPEPERRSRLVALAEQEAAQTPFGRQTEFPDLWKRAQEMLTSYSDAAYVGRDYDRELPAARINAIEVERASDDPPERIGRWLGSVADFELRRLDQQLLVDLLQIETRPDHWRKVLATAVDRIDNLVLIGDLGLAATLLDAVLSAGVDGQPFAEDARGGVERLRQSQVMKHVVLFLRQARESDVAAAARFCRTLGPDVIPALVEALAAEHAHMTVRRLRDVLLGFGAAGRPYADALRSSANPAVRRTAVELLRAYGGDKALAELQPLLDDGEPGVQREAIRAVLQIGSRDAHAILERSLTSGSARTRDAILQVLLAMRDPRVAPLLVGILQHMNHRGPLEQVHLSALEALGRVAGTDADAIAALRRALDRGDWWAPGRTRRLRRAAARALRSAGSDAADLALREAAAAGPRGARRAAREALVEPAAPTRAS